MSENSKDEIYTEKHRSESCLTNENPFLGIQNEVPVIDALSGYAHIIDDELIPDEFYRKMFSEIFGDLPHDESPTLNEQGQCIFFAGRKRTELDPEQKRDFYEMIDVEKLLFSNDLSFGDDGTSILERQFQFADALCLEYKLHFMVKGKYIPFVVERIAKAIKQDGELANTLRFFKTTDLACDHNEFADKDEGGHPMPEIVIYPSLGKQAVVSVARKLQLLFSDCSPKMKQSMSLNETPRYNVPIDEWLYLANGSADIKHTYMLMRDNVDAFKKNPEKYNQDVVTEYGNLDNLPPDRITFLLVNVNLPDIEDTPHTFMIRIPKSLMEMNIWNFSNKVKPISIVQNGEQWTEIDSEPNALEATGFDIQDLNNYLRNEKAVPDPSVMNQVQSAFEKYVQALWLEPAVRTVRQFQTSFLPAEVRKQALLFNQNPDILSDDGIFYKLNDASSVVDYIRFGRTYHEDEIKKEIDKAKKAIGVDNTN